MTTPRATASGRIVWSDVRRRLDRATNVGDGTSDDAQRILQERARELARAPAAPRAGRVLTVVAFGLGDELYAIEAKFAVEVRRLTDLTPLPGAPSHAVGVVNVRGEILVVFDLRPLLNLTRPAMTSRTRVLILGDGKAEFGLLVDRADEVRPLYADEVLPPAGRSGGGLGCLIGVTADGVAVLDGGALLKDSRFVADGTGGNA
jgi:purine-binding chemotaxis protein CheW